MDLFDKNGNKVGEIFEKGDAVMWLLGVVFFIILGIITLCIVCLTNWWGIFGYILGLILFLVAYILFFVKLIYPEIYVSCYTAFGTVITSIIAFIGLLFVSFLLEEIFFLVFGDIIFYSNGSPLMEYLYL